MASYARALAVCGRLDDATEQAAAAIDRAQRRGVPHHPALVDAYLAQAEVALWRNDLAATDTAQAEAERRAEHLRCPTLVAAARAVQAGVALRLGQPDRALTILAHLEGLPEGHPRHCIDAIRARALHRTGAIAAARRLARALPLGPATVLARAEVTADHDAELLAWLPDDEPASQLMAPLVLALHGHRAGRDDTWTHLAEALHQGERHGLLGPFAELPGALAITLAALPRTSPFAAAAVAAAEQSMAVATGFPLLTSTEIKVLTALASPLSLRQVADGLFVSTNTLKSHLQRIYRKLGVTSRAEAVAAARRLGLT